MSFVEARREQIENLISLIGKDLSPALVDRLCPALIDVVRQKLGHAAALPDTVPPEILHYVLEDVGRTAREKVFQALTAGLSAPEKLMRLAAFIELLSPSDDEVVEHLAKSRSCEYRAKEVFAASGRAGQRQLRASLWMPKVSDIRTVRRQSQELDEDKPEPSLVAAMLGALHEYFGSDENIAALRERFCNSATQKHLTSVASLYGARPNEVSGDDDRLPISRVADGNMRTKDSMLQFMLVLTRPFSALKSLFDHKYAFSAVILTAGWLFSGFSYLSIISTPSRTAEDQDWSTLTTVAVPMLILFVGFTVLLVMRDRKKAILCVGWSTLAVTIAVFAVNWYEVKGYRGQMWIFDLPAGSQYKPGYSSNDGQYRNNVIARSEGYWPLIAKGFEKARCGSSISADNAVIEACQTTDDRLNLALASPHSVAVTSYGDFQVGYGEFYLETIFRAQDDPSVAACGLRVSTDHKEDIFHVRKEYRKENPFQIDPKDFGPELLKYGPELLSVSKGDGRVLISRAPSVDIRVEFLPDVNYSPLIPWFWPYVGATKLAVYGSDAEVRYFVNDREVARSQRTRGPVALGLVTMVGGPDRGGSAECIYESFKVRALEG
ncbi:hypothetical protein [Micromonospora wenchangensis]|uniref:hypothetical protein n=1 Tax=Micromonospora wenchangensis TaxID=1185415 RepID=UPI001182384B|nr:hypothetical protein [Micromonospora wenchangensis]